jgi:hypothetical protein
MADRGKPNVCRKLTFLSSVGLGLVDASEPAARCRRLGTWKLSAA